MIIEHTLIFDMIQSVIDIVRKASDLMKTDAFEISEKGDIANIVTSSDVAVQDFLCRELAMLIPECGFLCEEEDIHDVTKEYTWVIDPIDGTANYSRGIAQSAICVGLRHNDEMVMGVVFIPMTDELFYAEKGKGAFLNGRQIHVSDRSFNNSIMCTALAVYYKEYAQLCSDIILETYKQINDIRRFGAAAPELCYLAMGRCELYFEYRLSPWDYAAASVILSEAGGFISDLNANPVNGITATGVLAGNTLPNLERLQQIVKSKMN